MQSLPPISSNLLSGLKGDGTVSDEMLTILKAEIERRRLLALSQATKKIDVSKVGSRKFTFAVGGSSGGLPLQESSLSSSDSDGNIVVYTAPAPRGGANDRALRKKERRERMREMKKRNAQGGRQLARADTDTEGIELGMCEGEERERMKKQRRMGRGKK